MVTRLQRAGLPHSEITGSKPVCSYPMLIAAYHVLLRLQKPRHPPSALVTFVSVSFDTFESQELPCLHLFSCFVCLWNCSPQLDSDFSRSPDSLFFRYRLSFSIFYLVISLNIVKQLFFVIYFPKNSVLQLLMAVYLKDWKSTEHYWITPKSSLSEFAPKRRCSSHTFRYGYLVTT